MLPTGTILSASAKDNVPKTRYYKIVGTNHQEFCGVTVDWYVCRFCSKKGKEFKTEVSIQQYELDAIDANGGILQSLPLRWKIEYKPDA